MEKMKLSNGIEIPAIGLGTWKITDKQEMLFVIKNAYEYGYRLFDTAAAYSNEMILGKVIKELQLPRETLFIQDKVWRTCYGYEETQEACKRTLRKLKLDYLDAYLIHWPATALSHENWQYVNAETWRGMERLYEQGYVRSVGVSNFKPNHLEELEKTAKMLPQLNQIECHPGMLQKDTLAYCQKKKIGIEASCPLGNGKILSNDLLVQIAESKGVSVARLCLKWERKHNLVILPKTTKVNRLEENMMLDDFDVSEEEMAFIDAMAYSGGLGLDSDKEVDFEKL